MHISPIVCNPEHFLLIIEETYRERSGPCCTLKQGITKCQNLEFYYVLLEITDNNFINYHVTYFFDDLYSLRWWIACNKVAKLVPFFQEMYVVNTIVRVTELPNRSLCCVGEIFVCWLVSTLFTLCWFLGSFFCLTTWLFLS